METDNKTYLAAAAPLEKSQTLITSFLLLIVLVSAVVLSLILTMWAKSRIHETGVLLSIGFGKASIIGQYLTEVLLIAAIAFGLSFFSGSLIAGRIGNSLLQLQYIVSVEVRHPKVQRAVAETERRIDKRRPHLLVDLVLGTEAALFAEGEYGESGGIVVGAGHLAFIEHAEHAQTMLYIFDCRSSIVSANRIHGGIVAQANC